jgi:hypothetical protein
MPLTSGNAYATAVSGRTSGATGWTGAALLSMPSASLMRAQRPTFAGSVCVTRLLMGLHANE